MVFNSAITSWFDGFKTLPTQEKDTKIDNQANIDYSINRLKTCEKKNDKYEKKLKKLNKNLQKKERQNLKLKLKLNNLKVDLKFSTEEKNETLKLLEKTDKKKFNTLKKKQKGGLLTGLLKMNDDKLDNKEEKILDNTKKKDKNKKKTSKSSFDSELDNNDDGTDTNWIRNSGVYCHRNYKSLGIKTNEECRKSCIESVGCTEYAINEEQGCRITKDMKKCCPDSMPQSDKEKYCYKNMGWNKTTKDQDNCPEDTCKLFKLKKNLEDSKKNIYNILGGYKMYGGENSHKCIDYNDSVVLGLIFLILIVYIIYEKYICPY